MSTVLYIKASPRHQRSKSVLVADAFLDNYRQIHKDDEVVELDLFDADLPAFDGLAVEAKYLIMHGQPHTDKHKAAWSEVEKVIDQFMSADKYVLAVPMWNFSIPYRLKQYIDILVQPGYTFSFDKDTGYQGLMKGKPLLVVYARGGQYPPGSEAAAFDQQRRYIEQVFGFMGFDRIDSVVVEPTLQGSPEDIKAAIDRSIEMAQALAGNF